MTKRQQGKDLHLQPALPLRNEWIFSSPSSATGCLTEPNNPHTRACSDAGLRPGIWRRPGLYSRNPTSPVPCFSSREVTAWGGLALLKRMLDGLDFRVGVQSWR
ncbi:MAG: hypothetical protein FP823_17395 [Rhodoferax sp.]|nr:hypothetical protein [Rhodoferax sp.]